MRNVDSDTDGTWHAHHLPNLLGRSPIRLASNVSSSVFSAAKANRWRDPEFRPERVWVAGLDGLDEITARG
jgi:hypothetical protein